MYDIYQFARLAGYSKETIAAAKGHCTQNGGDNDCEKGLPDACCYEVCPEIRQGGGGVDGGCWRTDHVRLCKIFRWSKGPHARRAV